MLTIEPKRISFPPDIDVLAQVDVDGLVSWFDWRTNRTQCAQLAEALTHFAAHGTFCPEPVKPVEWTEVVPGKVWVSGQWIITPRLLTTQWPWAMQNIETGYADNYKTPCDAKSYAESQIRKGTP